MDVFVLPSLIYSTRVMIESLEKLYREVLAEKV